MSNINIASDGADQFRGRGLGRGPRSINLLQSPPESPVASGSGQVTATVEVIDDTNLAIQEYNADPALGLPPPMRRAVRAGEYVNYAQHRTKWTKEMNTEVMRAYYEVNNGNDTPTKNWRTKLYRRFTQKYPALTHLDVGNVADRKRLIVTNKYLSALELAEIKGQVRSKLRTVEDDTGEGEYESNREDSSDTIESQSQEEDNALIESAEPEPENALNIEREREPEDENQMYRQVREKFYDNLQVFTDTDPTLRPRIPKVNTNKRISNILGIMNRILAEELTERTSFLQIHLQIYCAAATVVEMSGLQLKEQSRGRKNRHNPEPPKWQKRIQDKINKFRTCIARLYAFKSNPNNHNLVLKLGPVFKSLRVRPGHPTFETKIADYLDTLKQKVKMLGSRLTRYNKSIKRKQQNIQFNRNEKQFYRNLTTQEGIDQKPDKESIKQLWSNIWTSNVKHNSKAKWISDIKLQLRGLEEMEVEEVEMAEVSKAIEKTHNWKAPGVDCIQNFWLKKFTCTHVHLTRIINEALENPNILPKFITLGITHLLYKSGDSKDPKNYRPITCLCTVYKIITSVIAESIMKHLTQNTLLAWEQKGCTRGTFGCKEQLTIDAVILKQAQRKQRNLSIAYIDYSKAYDSVPHSWLKEVLKLYKIDARIINLIEHLMKQWRTSVTLENENIGVIPIRRGIFQGDTLSPIWFCMAVNPLSRLLTTTKAGYRLRSSNPSSKISHLLYMDDLKLFAETKTKLDCLINTTYLFSRDIGMAFGINKCAKLEIYKGKLKPDSEFDDVLPLGEELPTLEEGSLYKYLGIQQSNLIYHKMLKADFKKQYLYRLNKILNTYLNGKNMVKAINTWAIPKLAYSFGVVKWSESDLKALDRITRSSMAKFNVHHSAASVDRLYIPRAQGGRGLLNIEQFCHSQIIKIRTYFYSLKSELITELINQDDNYTPLNLKNGNINLPIITVADRVHDWKAKILHGRYPTLLEEDHTDYRASVAWLTGGSLFAETEGFMVAIQDQVIATKYYLKTITKTSEDGNCRLCQKHVESIDHIISACPVLAPTEYVTRHNQVAKIIHLELAKMYNILTVQTPPYYKYTPQAVLETENYTLYWDKQIITDRHIAHNKPDIILVNKIDNTALIIDVTIPLQQNIRKSEAEKIQKYKDLSLEIKRIWKLTRVRTIPIVISAMGTISSKLKNNLEVINLPTYLLYEMQKAVILQTCHITRRFFI